MMRLRTYLFYLCWALVTIPWGICIVIMCVLPLPIRHRIASVWADITMFLLRIICGIKYEIHGKENVPKVPVVMAVNHQSTWETIFLPIVIRKQVWVLKKELLYIPFFGWSMALLGAIAIDRSKRRQAMEEVITQGQNRLARGFSVVMFPEGHRFAPTAPLRFQSGAARLATELKVPLLPIAHNSGQFWPHGGAMHSGTIHLWIGEAIDTKDKSAKEVNTLAENWVREKRDASVQAEIARRQALK